MLVHELVAIGVSGAPVLDNYKRYKWHFATIEADIRHAMAIEVQCYQYYTLPIGSHDC
jgi:hypothetical protein